MRLLRAFIQTSIICLTGASAFASSPAGVWSRPDGVTILDADEAQPMVVIEGLFAVWTGEGPVGEDWGMKGYEHAAWGVMVYRCAVDDKAMCLLQWDEIKTAANDDGCVGWGDQETEAGTVRADDDTTSPDVWPLGTGVVPGFTPCTYLAAIPAAEPAPEASPEPGPELEAEPPPMTEEPPVEEIAEASPEPGPEPTAEPTTEVSATTTTTADTSTSTDTAVSGDAAEGGGCAGGGLGGLPALLGLVALLIPRRRRA